MSKQGSKRFALHRGMTNVFSSENDEEQKLHKNRKEMETNILDTAADLIEATDSSSKLGSNAN